MSRVSKWSTRLFAFAAAFCLIAGVWTWRVAPEGDEGIVLDSPTVTFAPTLAGLEFPVFAAVTNRSHRTLYVVGVDGQCNAHGCVRGTGAPLEVPAHTTRKFELRVETAGEGEFAGEVNLFTNNPAQPPLTVSVHGQVLPTATGSRSKKVPFVVSAE